MMGFGIHLATVVLLWMTALVPAERVPWGHTYQETAYAITEACDEDIRCAAVLVAIGYHESRFDPAAVGDRGRSLGLFQVSTAWGAPSTISEQARLARTLVARSFAICRERPRGEALGWYCAGGVGCGRPASSHVRMKLAASLLGNP